MKDNIQLQRDWTSKYPGLVLKQIKDSAYVISGVVCISENWIRLKLSLPHFPSVRDFQLYVQHHLEYVRYNTDNLQIEPGWQIEDLLTHVAKIQPEPETISRLPRKNIYAEILELHKPHKYRMQLNDSCSRMRFSNFVEYENHFLELELPSMRVLEHSLPDCISLSEMLSSNAYSLTDALSIYLKLLDDLRPFYLSFADIDELCDVLQPSPITTKHNNRVFPLKERVYLKVTIADPISSFGSMAVQIIGPTEEVAHLRHVLSDGLSSWDTELDMHKNLLRIFDLCYFPMPAGIELGQTPMDDKEQHCNICYVYRLDDGQVPLVSCDNARCVLKCHATCLKEWFDTLIDGRTFLEVSFGLCPFCKAKLSTSFAALLKT